MSHLTSANMTQTVHVQPKATSSPDDLEAASKTLSRSEKAVLQVIDAPYDGTTPQLRAVFSYDDDIADGMKSLPPHDIKTARIIDVTVHSEFIITGLRDARGPQTTRSARDNLIKYLQDNLHAAIRRATDI